MMSEVTNVLATALNFNEQLEKEVQARIEEIVMGHLRTEGYAAIESYTKAHLQNLGMDHVRNCASDLVTQHLHDFSRKDTYIQHHSGAIRAMARSEAQALNKEMLRLFTGSYNI
jgi:hypothetical protein